MSIAEGVQAQVTYKAYASGVITANALAVSASDLAAAGAQILRRVSSSLKLEKATYQSAEVRADRQIVDYRHGVKRVTGSVSGEFSPGSYFPFFEAACRGTKAAAITLGPSQLTSLSADNTTSKFTAAGGDPVALGLRVGTIFRLTGMSDPDNNTKNFLITGFSGGSNRTILVYPAPDTMTADTSFSLVTTGKSIIVPSSSFVSRKFGIEHYFNDLDIGHLFTECRSGGFTIQLPASGMSTVEFPFMGRDMELNSGASAPFFTSPTAAGTTGIFAAVNGLLQVGGSTVGVVTGLNIQMNLNPSADPVVGQNFVPEIFLGPANVTGQVTAMLQDNVLVTDFKNETEVSILAYLTSTTDVNSPAVSIYLPRIKFGDAPVAVSGDGAQILTMPFQALKYVGSGVGIEQTTFQLWDTEAT